MPGGAATRLEPDDANATYRPSAEIDGSADELFGKPPPTFRDTRVVEPGGGGIGASGTGVGPGGPGATRSSCAP